MKMVQTNRRTRNLLFKLHSWMGLHLFVLMSLFFLTGTLLVFVFQIEAIFFATERLQAPVALEERPTFGELYDQARLYAPDGVVLEIIRSSSDWIADRAKLFVPGSGFRFVWFSSEGMAVGRETGAVDLRHVIHDLHVSFMAANKITSLAATSFSFVLAAFLVSGIVTYRRFWRGFFRLPATNLGPRGWWGGLHRLIAVWLLPFLIIISITGMYYFVDYLGLVKVRQISNAGMQTREAALPKGFDGGSLDTAVAVAQEVAPDLHIHMVRVPGLPRESIVVMGSDGAALMGPGSSRIAVDPSSMEILDAITTKNIGMVGWVTNIVESLHFGTWGGLVSQWLWVVFGSLATGLSLAGVMVYASRSFPADQNGKSFARFWSGIMVLKWGYPLFFAGLIGIGLYRFL